MASNTNPALLGTAVENNIRKITTDETASANQTVTGGVCTHLISSGGFIGASNNTGAVFNLKNAVVIIKDDSTTARDGAIRYGDNWGKSTLGKVYFDNVQTIIYSAGNVDLFFSKLTNSSVIVANTGAKLLRLQDGGTLQNTKLLGRSDGQLGIELHGDVTILNNTFENLKTGFINFSSGKNLKLEGQNFIGTVDRLGWSYQGHLEFIDCRKDGVYLTEAQIKAYAYIRYSSTSSIKFSKRQKFSIKNSLGSAITSAKTIYQINNANPVEMVGASVDYLSNLLKIADGVYGAYETAQVFQESSWAKLVSATNKHKRSIRAWGFVPSDVTYSSYDTYETLDNAVISLESVAGLVSTESQASNITGITFAPSSSSVTVTLDGNKTAQDIWDRWNWYCIQSANVNVVYALISRSGSALVVTGDVSQAAPADMAGVTITGNLTFNSATNATITLNGCTISGAVSNSGTGTVTINLSNGSSIGTVGNNITIVSGATVTFTGMPTGCDIVILTAGTSTVLHSVDQAAGTSYSWPYSTEGGAPTVDVGFIKPGYVPFYLRNVQLGLTDSSIPVSMTPDRNYLS